MTIRDFAFRVAHGFQGYPVQVGNHRFRIDESLRRWNFDGEQEVRKALEQNLESGDLAIDVGANFGMHTLIMARQVAPSGRVIAFEPIPENIRLFRRNIALNRFDGSVELHSQAISDLPTEQLEMTIKTTGLEPSAGIKTSEQQGMTNVLVKNSSLDRACGDLRCDQGCLVKIDVEGAELSVLRSGLGFIKRVKPKLLIEVHTYALPAFGATTQDVHALLDQNHYRTTRLTEMANANGEYYHILAVADS